MFDNKLMKKCDAMIIMNVDSVSHNLVKSCYAMLDYNLKFQSPFYNILQHLKLRKTLYLN